MAAMPQHTSTTRTYTLAHGKMAKSRIEFIKLHFFFSLSLEYLFGSLCNAITRCMATHKHTQNAWMPDDDVTGSVLQIPNNINSANFPEIARKWKINMESRGKTNRPNLLESRILNGRAIFSGSPSQYYNFASK